MVSSSIPSEPCTTHTRCDPKLANTWAMGSIHSRANTPRSWRLVPAGLDRGPSRLKMVRVPSSTRVPATCRIAP